MLYSRSFIAYYYYPLWKHLDLQRNVRATFVTKEKSDFPKIPFQKGFVTPKLAQKAKRAIRPHPQLLMYPTLTFLALTTGLFMVTTG